MPVRKVLRLAHLRELAKSYGPRGVLFVGVNTNNWETREEIADQAGETGSLSDVKDGHHAIADRLGAPATPEALVVDSEGQAALRGWVKSKQESPDLQRALWTRCSRAGPSGGRPRRHSAARSIDTEATSPPSYNRRMFLRAQAAGAARCAS